MLCLDRRDSLMKCPTVSAVMIGYLITHVALNDEASPARLVQHPRLMIVGMDRKIKRGSVYGFLWSYIKGR